jgi:ABC-type sugar transport system substrate-binding protein
MNWFRALAALAATAGMLVLASAAQATKTYSNSVKGIEFYATSTQGWFTGGAGGDLPGSWLATIHHTPLGPVATIDDGDFDLATAVDSVPMHGTATGPLT